MAEYNAPVSDILATIKHGIGFDRLQKLPDQDELNEELLSAILDEASKFAGSVLAPINESGDREGSKRKPDGTVEVPAGFKDAYKQFCDMGWNGISFDPNHGGQGLPWSINFTVQEMWQSANMSFGLCPMLTQGTVEALQHHGAKEQQDKYLEKLISGEWTGTMNLTEPHAGSDLGELKSKAVKQADGSYKITGQKIFITFGDHEMSENIIHLVLARAENAPEGVKGISMFLVPKYLVNDDGSLGGKNDVSCTSLEHKLGIHASPTCTMQFGDDGGATGFLIGNENEGLKYMFTMMNNARLAVGLQGVAIAERAYQHALDYAHERQQGKSLATGKDNAPIIDHPDVERMLASMRAKVLAGRLLASHAVMNLDEANMLGDQASQDMVDILTPIVKAWCTDKAVEVASQGVQVFGGMGFIEETGAAQFYRDARILPIYEGTNGIQAADLSFRKILRDGGASMKAAIADLESRLDSAEKSGAFDPEDIAVLRDGLSDVNDVLGWMLKAGSKGDFATVASSSHDILSLCGNVFGSIYLAEMAGNAKDEPAQDYTAMAKFLIHQEAVQAPSLKHRIKHNLFGIKGKSPFTLRP